MRGIKLYNPDVAASEKLAERLFSDGMPEGISVIYRGRNTVGVLPGAVPACIKCFAEPGVVKGAIYGFCRLPKALRAYNNAYELLKLGFDTPQPIAAVCNTSLGLLKSSYYVCRYAEGLDDLRGAENRANFPELAKALASYMNRLHSSGVLMKDFTQGNVLFRRDESGIYHFTLVDINRVEFGVGDRKRLMSNFGAVLDTADGLAVLAREYAALQSDPPAVEAEIREIYARRQARLWRKRRIKEFIRGKKK